MNLSTVKTIYVTCIVTLFIVVSGCNVKVSQKQQAEQRLCTLIQEAKLVSARQHIQQGEYPKARVLLESLVTQSNNLEAKAMLSAIEEPKQNLIAVK